VDHGGHVPHDLPEIVVVGFRLHGHDLRERVRRVRADLHRLLCTRLRCAPDLPELERSAGPDLPYDAWETPTGLDLVHIRAVWPTPGRIRGIRLFLGHPPHSVQRVGVPGPP